MGRFRKKSGRVSGAPAVGSGPWAGTILTIFGSVSLLVCLIMFGIGIQQLDTAYTAAGTYTEQVSLQSIMGPFGMVIFLAFMMLGLGAVVGGGYLNIKRGLGGGWTEILMLAIFGGITLVISLIMFGIINTQLHTAYTTANGTTNIASFVGLLSVMGVWGVVIFVSMIGSALAQFGFAGFGAYNRIKG